MEVQKFKYPITEEHLEQALQAFSTLTKLNEKDLFLSIKEEVYKNCPDNILPRDKKGELILYRIATKIPASEEDFLPHMYGEKWNIFSKKIKEIAREIKYNRKYKKQRKDELVQHFCSRFSVSVFEKLEDAVEITRLLKNAKIVVEGKVNQEIHGPVYKKPFDSSSHKDWFPFQEVNELALFSKIVFQLLPKSIDS